jgi:hypothetical protein
VNVRLGSAAASQYCITPMSALEYEPYTATSANLVTSETCSFVSAVAEWFVRGFPASA